MASFNFLKDLWIFLLYLFDEFTTFVKAIVRPTILAVIMGLFILYDSIFQDSSHVLFLSCLLIFLIMFTEYIRGDWKHFYRKRHQ